MKTRPKIKKSHTISSLAGTLEIPVHVLREAKKAGADGFAANGNVDPLRLLAWCLTKGQEFESGQSYDSARATLAIARAEQLQQRAAIVSEELAPISEQRRALDLAVWSWILSLHPICEKLALQVAPTNHNIVSQSLRCALQETVVASVAAACSQLDLPRWVEAAMRHGAELGRQDDGGGWFESLKQLIAAGVGVDFVLRVNELTRSREERAQKTEAWLQELDSRRSKKIVT